jgi:3-methyladenine DNA glycosylase/8-oxoguanine DNA glycosylase
VRRARAARLARIGLSKPKIRTLKAVGAAVANGSIDLEAVGRMEADEAHDALVALHGIGPWTADIYLLFCLGHADAWPAGDLALQGSRAVGLRAEGAADGEGDDRIRRSVAAMARGGSASALGLLCRGQTARSRADQS